MELVSKNMHCIERHVTGLDQRMRSAGEATKSCEGE